MANLEKFKMATGENHFMTKSECLLLQTKFVNMVKCKKDKYGYNGWLCVSRDLVGL